MSKSLVLTVIAPDRPGWVESLAALVAEHDGNWLESRMAHLAGQFAGILRVDVPDAKRESLTRALHALEGEGLKVVVETSLGAVAAPRRALRLDLVGQDRPGIVREISRALAACDVNIEELVTECSSAPMSGELLFRASANLSVPEQVTTRELGERLEALANDLMVDLQLDNSPGGEGPG